MTKSVLALTFLASATSFAAEAPYYDAITQIETVIQSTELAAVAAGAPIGALKRLGSMDYEVSLAGNCGVVVSLDVVAPEKHIPGKIQYRVMNVSQKRCK
jgi:hypothetical protein